MMTIRSQSTALDYRAKRERVGASGDGCIVGLLIGNFRLVEEAKSFENEAMVRRKGFEEKVGSVVV